MLISYMPQHYRIIARGTSEGISPYFVLLGTTSATAGFANILTLPKSIQDASCCKELETFECVAGVLGIVQLGVQWACFAFMSVRPRMSHCPCACVNFGVDSSCSWSSSAIQTPIFLTTSLKMPRRSLDGRPRSWSLLSSSSTSCLLSLSVLSLSSSSPHTWAVGPSSTGF